MVRTITVDEPTLATIMQGWEDGHEADPDSYEGDANGAAKAEYLFDLVIEHQKEKR